jgi:carboxylate-amine ligase
VRFPTLEMRITDVCTRLDDAIAIAALYRCLVRMLMRLRRANQRWREYSTFLLNENRWLAQRHGPGAALIDFGKGEPVPFADLIEEAIAFVAEDAAAFGCEAEVADLRRIVREGTSADRQLAVYDRAVAAGQSAEGALKAVVDHLIVETVAGCEAAPRAVPATAGIGRSGTTAPRKVGL